MRREETTEDREERDMGGGDGADSTFSVENESAKSQERVKHEGARERKEGGKSTHLIRHYAFGEGGQVYIRMEYLQSKSEFVKRSCGGDGGIGIVSGRRRTGPNAKGELGRIVVSTK
jgi:hypothetical protein